MQPLKYGMSMQQKFDFLRLVDMHAKEGPRGEMQDKHVPKFITPL